jgi:hypothetical protein
MPSQVQGELRRQGAHLISGHRMLGRLRQELEDPWSASVRRQILHSRNDMEMDVAEPVRLGELDDVRLYAAGHGVQRAREPNLPATEAGGFGIGELGDGQYVPTWEEHQPTRQGASHRVCYAPMVVEGDPFVRRQLVDLGVALAGDAAIHDCHVPSTP